ncbi:MAG: hypothetical protein ACLQVX_21145 [Limisphaerales bacterium]
MRISLNAASICLISLCLSTALRAQRTPAPGDAAPIQAIQQAADPSGAVAAYANGIALGRQDPGLYEAYIARMVDFGLPELAYHQAQALTTLQSSNGLAWGVVAYVDARRGQMPEAILAINLAGQFAPENKFVARTAGELVAWYDLKADKTAFPDKAKEGLAKIRALLDKQPGFTAAYDTARKAYQAQAEAQSGQYAPSPQDPGAPSSRASPAAPPPPQATAQGDLIAPLGYTPPPTPPPYYPDYSDSYYGGAPDFCDDWGPGWVAPAPWCWWQPCGFWGGCGFLPFGAVCVFGGDFDRRGRFGHTDHWGRNGAFGPEHNPGAWHTVAHGHDSFFGTPARPSAAIAQWTHEGSLPGGAERGSISDARSSWTGRFSDNLSFAAPRPGSPGAGQFARYRAMPVYRAQVYASPHWATPGGGSLGAYRQAPYSGGFHSGGSLGSSGAYREGGFRSGGSSGGSYGGRSFGGGSHGGGFGGGGHGGGGHR